MVMEMPGSSTHSRKNGNCPRCKIPLRSWSYDVGYGVVVPTKHCTRCQYNHADPDILNAALAKLRARMAKDVKLVAVGEGLGIRFPKEFVAQYSLEKGKKVTLKPGKKGVEVVF
jgi:hypothetical protein